MLVAVYVGYRTARYFVLDPAADVFGQWVEVYMDTGSEAFKELSKNTDTATKFMGKQIETIAPSAGIGLIIMMAIFALGWSGGVKGVWGK